MIISFAAPNMDFYDTLVCQINISRRLLILKIFPIATDLFGLRRLLIFCILLNWHVCLFKKKNILYDNIFYYLSFLSEITFFVKIGTLF